MMILKIIRKLVLILILILIGITRLILSTVAKLYCFVAVWIWMLLAVCAIVTVHNQKWEQTFLIGLVEIVTFEALFGSLMIEALLKEIGHYFKEN